MFRQSKKDEGVKKRTNRLSRTAVSDTDLPALVKHPAQSAGLARGLWGEKKLSLPPVLNDPPITVTPFKRLLKANDVLIKFTATSSVYIKPYQPIRKGDVITLYYSEDHKSGAVYFAINHDQNITCLPSFVLDGVLPTKYPDNIYLTSIHYLKNTPDLIVHLLYAQSRPLISPATLAQLFLARGELTWLLQFMTTYECQHLKGGNTLFRETDNSPLMSVVISLISPKHNPAIKYFVDGLVCALLRENNRVKDGYTAHTAMHLVKYSITYLSLRLEAQTGDKAGSGVPDDLIYILKLVRNSLILYFNPETTYQILGSILMLRIINPLVVEDKALLEVGKKLQSLSNQAIKDDGDELLCRLMRELIDKLCMASCKDDPFSCESDVDNQAKLLYDIVSALETLSPDEGEAISAMIAQIGEPDLVSEKKQEVRRLFPLATLSPRLVVR